ncbi:MAG: phosphotransferase family protein [Actinomycetota bacterium]
MFDDVLNAVARAGDVLSNVGITDVAVGVRPVGGGGISSVFDVSTRDGANYIVKIYPDAFAWKLAKEVFVYRQMAAVKDLPTPKVIGWDDSRSIIDANFLVLSKLPGDMMSAAVDASVDEQANVYRQLGKVARSVHRLTFDQFGYLYTGVVAGHATNKEYMRLQFDKKLAEFRALGGVAEVGAAIERFVDERADAFGVCVSASLCHDDMYENNILVERTSRGLVLSGLLDVENAVAADPLIDLSKTWLYSIRSADHKWRGLVEGYGDLGDRAAERLDLYRLYHSLELWDWFAQTGNRIGVESVSPDLVAFSSTPGEW